MGKHTKNPHTSPDKIKEDVRSSNDVLWAPEHVRPSVDSMSNLNSESEKKTSSSSSTRCTCLFAKQWQQCQTRSKLSFQVQLEVEVLRLGVDCRALVPRARTTSSYPSQGLRCSGAQNTFFDLIWL
jgi:hypothetical protein